MIYFFIVDLIICIIKFILSNFMRHFNIYVCKKYVCKFLNSLTDNDKNDTTHIERKSSFKNHVKVVHNFLNNLKKRIT